MKRKILFYYILGLLLFPVFAQCQDADSVLHKNQTDIKDIVHDIFKNHIDKPGIKTEDFQFAVFPVIGYTSNTGLAISIGTNAIFHMKGSSKESNIGTSFSYTQFNQILLPFTVNIWSKNDRFNYILDNKFITYPSPLYGLRGRSKLDSGYSVNFNWLKLHASALTRISKDFYGGLGLFYDYFWNINEEGLSASGQNTNSIRSAFEHYYHINTPSKKESAFGPAFRLLFDSRDNPVNASKGFYGSILYHPVFKGLGSDTSWSSLVIDARKYFSFSQTRENVLAFWFYLWEDFGKPPFMLLPSTGWDDFWNTGRGYSQGRYRGKSMNYFESEYRFQISPNGLFGGVIFANLQYFPSEIYTSYSERRSRQGLNVFASGAGTGIRIKFNKYSKTNVALDAGFGQQFPKPWFAVNLGEVF